jgi:hypothetical protein
MLVLENWYSAQVELLYIEKVVEEAQKFQNSE